MATQIYGPNAAIDPETGRIAEDGEGQVYAPSDRDYEHPLAVTNLDGAPMNSIRVIGGATEQFRIEGHYPAVIWKDAVSGTAVALDALGGNVPPGGTPGQVLTKTSAADFQAEWIDPPEGGGGGTLGGSVQFAYGSAALRPTTSPLVMVLWVADSPPQNAMPGIDIWLNAPA